MNELKEKLKFELIPFPGIWLITELKEHIGQLAYNNKRKQWELAPYEDTCWTMDCLADVISFVKQLKPGQEDK